MTGGKPQWPHEDDDGLPQWSLDVSDTLLHGGLDSSRHVLCTIKKKRITCIKKSFNCHWTVYGIWAPDRQQRPPPSVADPDPGSGAFWPLDPGSGIRDPEWVFSGSRISDPASRISDPGSRIPRPYFEELFDNFFGKKFYNSMKIGPIFFFSTSKLK